MNTRTMIFGGTAAMALLIGVAFFAVAAETDDGTMLGETALGDMLRKGMDNGKGEVERAMDGECDPEDAEQAREQEKLQDGSCDVSPSEGSGEMKQERFEGGNAPEEAEQVREKLQDGSCGDETGEMKQNRTGDPYQVREREQIRNQTCEPIQNRTGNATQIQERDQLRNGSCGNETGEMKQERSEGGNAPEEAEQVREQKKNGSCDDDTPEDEDIDMISANDASDGSKDRSGVQQHDRDRDQDNGGTGPEYRNGAV